MKAFITLALVLSASSFAGVIPHETKAIDLRAGDKIVLKTNVELKAHHMMLSTYERLFSKVITSKYFAGPSSLMGETKFKHGGTCLLEALRLADGYMRGPVNLGPGTVLIVSEAVSVKQCEDNHGVNGCQPALVIKLKKKDKGLEKDEVALSCNVRDSYEGGRLWFKDGGEITLKDIRDTFDWNLYFKQ